MTRFCGILTMAAGLALAGCQGVNNWGWHNTASDQPSYPSEQVRNGNNLNDPSINANSSNPTNQYNSAAPRGYSNAPAARTSSSYSSNSYSSNSNPNMSANQTASAQNNPVQPTNSGAGQLDRVNDKMPAANLSVADRDFVVAAAAGGMYEVQSSQSALLKSTDNRVKNIAQHMIDDHTKANNQLKTLAQKNGFALDTVGMTTDQRNMIDSLNKLNGSEFDREYLRQQQAAHQDTIAKFQRAASSADDKDLRDWAATTLPTLREHLAMITNDQAINPPGNVGSER